MRSGIKFKWLFFPLLLLAILPCCIGLYAFSFLLSGIVIAWYTARYGLQYTLWSVIPLFIIGFLPEGKTLGILFCAHVISAFIIGVFMNKQGKFSLMLIASTLAEAAVLTGYTIYLCDTVQTTPADFLFGNSLQQFLDIIAASGQLDIETLSEMQIFIRYISDMLQSMLPFFYLAFALFYVYSIFAITRFCLKKQDVHIDTMPFFFELWLPRSVSGIFVILFLFSFFTDSPILANVVSFMFMLHVICGISVADFYMRGKGLPGGVRALIIAVLIAIASMMGGLATSVLCCIGMSDGARGVRK